MNAGDYTDWATRAFCYCEAALLEEIATPSRLCITEELVRSAFVRGLAHTNPGESARLRTEEPAAFTSRACWKDPAHGTSSGRPIAHDVAVVAGQDASGSLDAGMVAEVKWLKQNKAHEIGKDIWKLAFARGTVGHQRATRTFLLVGGEATSVTATLKSLLTAGLPLRWSKAGRRGGAPGPTTISLGAYRDTKPGRAAFDELLGWGTAAHVREPPNCAWSLTVTRRTHWLRTLPGTAGSTSWRLVLWELTGFGTSGDTIDWPTTKANETFKC